jgi:hypothetical protein
MPVDPPKKQTQIETQHELITNHNKYLLTVRKSPTSTMLYIGGVHFWCLECQIFPDKKVANLPKIEYNDGCSLSGKFERGKDIKIIMHLLLSYIQDNYPIVNAIHFNDFSFRNCNATQTVDLAPFYYLLYGKTWYMRHMDATFVEDDESLKFAEASERFQEMKIKMKWEDFDSYITTKHPLSVAEMKLMFESNTSWSSYFLELLEKTDMGVMCLYLAPWITNFVAKVGKIRFHSPEFSMPVPNPFIGKIEYRIGNYIARGGKHTRRQPRKRGLDLR